MTANRTEGTSLRVYPGPKLKERLRRLAFKRRVSMSALATMLLEEALTGAEAMKDGGTAGGGDGR